MRHSRGRTSIFSDFIISVILQLPERQNTDGGYCTRKLYKPITLEPNAKLLKIENVSGGTIHLIRFIRRDQELNILGKKSKVSKELVYSYVRAATVTVYLNFYLRTASLCLRLARQFLSLFHF